jgi:hypothetical protein
MTRSLWLLAACLVGLIFGACMRTANLECYAVDPNSPIVVAEVDPMTLYENYCGRGPAEFDGLQRRLAMRCVPRPEAGCDPCELEADEVDALFQASILERFEEIGCPVAYEPGAFVRGCFAEWTDSQECCWVAEYFSEAEICDPGPPIMVP